MKVHIIDGDDWIAVVVDGQVVEQGHSLAPFHWAEILRSAGVEVEETTIEDDEDGDKITEAIDAATTL